MHPIRFISVSLLLSCALAAHANAQDERTTLISRIVSAQGLMEMFDLQMSQQKETVQGYATQLFAKTMRDFGGQPTARQRAALERLAIRSAVIFSAQELVAAWSAQYGKELSLDDLLEILRYYESPVGRRDVAASKTAMSAFTQWVAQESQVRASVILADFASELKATGR